MGYCTTTQVDRILAQALTTASPTNLNTPGKLTSIGRSRRLGLIPDDDVLYYIRLSDAHINAALSQQYAMPLKEIADFETTLSESIDEYTDNLQITNWSLLTPGDTLVVTDGDVTEKVEISEIDLTTGEITTAVDIGDVFDSSNTRVLRVKFPDPIPFISARLTAAAIYDRIAKAQNEPGKSDYSEIVRQEAITELNNIREGRTILHGVRRIGWRFANANLIDRYGLKAPIDQDGTRSDNSK
jgi:hypothetical protein